MERSQIRTRAVFRSNTANSNIDNLPGSYKLMSASRVIFILCLLPFQDRSVCGTAGITSHESRLVQTRRWKDTIADVCATVVNTVDSVRSTGRASAACCRRRCVEVSISRRHKTSFMEWNGRYKYLRQSSHKSVQTASGISFEIRSMDGVQVLETERLAP